MGDDKKKYNYMENVLKEINGKFVSLSDEDIKRNNNILKSILDLMTTKMRLRDNLFREMYSTVFFGGSFYDGLRVGEPNEFDLDLLLSLPKIVEPTITTSNIPGFVHLQLKEYQKLIKQQDLFIRYRPPAQAVNRQNVTPAYRRPRKNFSSSSSGPFRLRNLDKLIDENNYLDTSKVLKWMESVVTMALNEFEKNGNQYVLRTNYGVFYARVCKGGPAFTLRINGLVNNKNVSMDVDLVPCFIFGKEKWPVNGFRSNPITSKTDYFIVPKPLKNVPKSNRYWRLSFQQQERVIIDSKRNLKPTLRLLKKLRDTMDHKCIASYYIKTVVMWQAFQHRDEEFWRNSLSYVFMTMLKDYSQHLSDAKMPYFWNKNNDLIKNISKETIANVSNRIKVIIADIEKHPENPFIVAKYLLTRSEFETFKKGLSSNGELSVLLARISL